MRNTNESDGPGRLPAIGRTFLIFLQARSNIHNGVTRGKGSRMRVDLIDPSRQMLPAVTER